MNRGTAFKYKRQHQQKEKESDDHCLDPPNAAHCFGKAEFRRNVRSDCRELLNRG